jgi:hypothetical protein
MRNDLNGVWVPRLRLSGGTLIFSSGAISTPYHCSKATFDGPLDLVSKAPRHNAPI